jgi:cellulose synthase/poly-beta-1,6-N-acetylglucosamine synthase-like glycosyltransferase
MLAAFYILIGLQILLGIYGLAEIWLWLGYVRRRLGRGGSLYAPRVALLCPVKGAEPGLEKNLTALTEFDYSSYEVFFAAASSLDRGAEIARHVAEASRVPAHLVIAGEPKDESEKVSNLRAAVEQLGPAFEVLVFADPDGRPDRAWLGRLVAPLADPKLGAATAFRWLVPAGGFWSALAAAWNASAVSLLGAHGRNFCWGGGVAIRREVFEEAKVAEFWRGAVSDDFAMTRALRHAGRRIEFVPECLVPSETRVGFGGLLEFANRQMILTRVYEPGLWARAFVAHWLYSLTLVYAAVVWAVAPQLAATRMTVATLTFIALLLVALRGLVRWLAAAEALPEWRARLVEQSWAWVALAPLVGFLYAWSLLVAAFVRRIRWRGISYQIVSPNQTRIARR